MNLTPDVNSLRITVVTPNYNGGSFLEATIRSVLSQNYQNLEYILVDGASSDKSMRIVERYADHFAHIISEKDEGHADAVNKGFKLATGDVLAWINSDDLLLPNALHRVNHVFSAFPEVQWLTGRPSTARESGELDPLRPLRMWSWIRFLCGDFRYIQQESTFWRRSLWQESGATLNTHYRLANDFDLWLRFFRRASLYTIDAPLGCFRIRSGQRSVAYAADYERECDQAFEAFVNAMPAALLARYLHIIPTEQLRSRKVKPATLPSQLNELDPPLITFDSKTGKVDLPEHRKRDLPMEFKPDVSATEDMVFDGFDRIAWSSGPQFAGRDLIAAEIEFEPFAPNVAIPGGLSEVSPPMVALIGPLAISDWGGGKMTLQVKFRDGAVSHDLSVTEAGRSYHMKLLLSADRYTIILDGRTVAVDRAKGPQVMHSPIVILGGGHAQRFWVGTVRRVAVTLSARSGSGNDQAERTYQLTHKSGIQTMPRWRRSQLSAIRTSPTSIGRPPTPLTFFRNRHRGQRCFVMGNGPSLNKMDLEKLSGEVVFACNSAFLLFERVSWRPTYYTCVDTRVIRDRAADISAMLDQYPSITAFFPTVIHLHDGSGAEFSGRDVIPPGPNRYYFNEVGNRESHNVETMFSLDADDYVVQPYTVAITMLQLAAFMGFSEIYLIGCDTSYKVQETVKQEGKEIEGVGLLLTSTRDDDSNHFDPRYFGKGREWHNPQVNKMIAHYRWARLALRRTGIQVFNATVGGQLEVFQRVDFNNLFLPQSSLQAASVPVSPRKSPLLSIAIPAYDRPAALIYSLERLLPQISGKYEGDIEIIVTDDCSPNDSLRQIRELAAKYPFLHYRRHEKNIGLEKNLLACAETCTGEFLWLFGDDDFLEKDDALDRIISELRESPIDALVLNRTRRSTDLATLISPNWMNLDPNLRKRYAGLRDFCFDFGLISVLGFISTNIFRRRLFQRIDAKRYLGTMYPQLGALIEAFHSRPTLLLGAPLVCHRTQTPDEKRRALGTKASEADFMADSRRRNAIYFSHPYIAMLDDLVARGAFSHGDLMRLTENTVINGFLVDFLLDCVRLSDELNTSATDAQWARTAKFLASMPLDPLRRAKIAPVLARRQKKYSEAPTTTVRAPMLAISVVTPSYNQAEFLPDCLKSVCDQTYPPIEHLVFDPGSKDSSREIAAGFSTVTLFAEPDEGQSDALNKGFARARGDIIAWLNSDDMLADDGVFERVIARFAAADAPDIVYGKGIYVDAAGKKLRDAYINSDPASLIWRLHQEDGIMQPALFMRRSVIERVGPLRGDLHFSMDYEYWIRCVKAGVRFAFIDSDLAIARYHLSNKTYGQRGSSYGEVCRMTKEHFGYVNHIWVRRYAEFLAEGHDGVLAHGGNVGIRDKTKLERIYRDLLLEHNGDLVTQDILRARQTERGYGETFREMEALGLIGAPDAGPRVPKDAMPLYGPFDRARAAHYDETECIAELYSGGLVGKMMIDVGAHHGWALAPFLAKGWTIYAFEPDEKNRTQVLERLANHKNKVLVTLDTRCVSNKSRKGVPFYRSEQSTGISGLSAFHESHAEAQRVDTVTLAEFLADKPLSTVDFLKIDTEGHDLFVLQGFPWERAKPAVIECEFEDTKTVPLGYTFHDLARFLVDKGYSVYVSEWHPIIRYGIRHDWNRLVRYPCELADNKGWGNLLAFRDGIDETGLVAAVRKVVQFGSPAPKTQSAPNPGQAKALVPVTASSAGLTAAESTDRVLRPFRVERNPLFVELSPSRWRYTHSDTGQKLWQAVFDVSAPTAGRSFVAGMRLISSRAMTVTVGIGRHGNSPYEGATKRIALAPDVAQTVTVRKEFKNQYSSLKVQVEVWELEGGGTADLTIDSLSICETLASIQRRIPEGELRLSVANRLFREGDYAVAMGMYLLLSRQRPLTMYSDNALMAARKSGTSSVQSVEDLLKLVQ